MTDTPNEQPAQHRLAVIGAGVMGTNITALATGHGLDVTLVDVDEETLTTARRTIRHKLGHAQLMNALPDGRPRGTVTTTTRLDGITGATTVIEAVVEIAEVKRKVLAEASALTAPGTLLISNTSCVPVDEMAGWVVRGEELVGVHFMNPSYLIKMVEVIRGTATADTTMDAVGSLLHALGREALVVNDAPGFVINRLLHPLINRAALLVQEGVATAETVDGLLEGCLGHTTGPLRTADLIGIDNLVDSLQVLHERTGDPECAPCELMLQKVADGHHGRKTGRGFYDYRTATKRNTP
ncbi:MULTISPECIES: 3-hydroxyacyl-CoA dehydrogenase family protein [Streptomyces]|uniref:3-hydroxyacyl-CoA dehydrogenase family protein n=1 Tax=Streptomyces tsukubensis (strain DSM 42081 / NBRC 108919 / NRRL 18488 / 9993) TaxID=1114943 RepID=I2NBS0_STRT9|nr:MULTISPECIES: 3-hydroxyacyl-CoA dehydrogenase family protein [Streptomyces]AZK92541.1 3-hydroxyacyl-CoA dehydrogenase [Streptomyces tsukubensis]EIF94467.1 methoxymalonate biosynthesis protein [Streptomyces tsukubensis NRRL18488]MYS64996.1 3-hydroxyacyl-CoA dehydrogenase family protein [Streptomyces sp. SID5473]QKM65913.1 3-hydroxyacyl-CoA dehydrogenase family protein [Streptomyces tsukubensis NRRL18488]TAI40946.1 3-hydroxyacyl-CoA dehydrogenase family protein [Streptomyces tsukubensis]